MNIDIAQVRPTPRPSSPEASAVGEAVREMRERKGLTQHQLASKIGLSRTSVTNIEKGTQGRVSVEVLSRIAEALSVELQISFKDKDSQ